MEFDNLSTNWTLKPIGKLTKINELSLKKDTNLLIIEYLDTSSVTENIFSETQTLKLKESPSRAKRILRNGDTIVSTVRPNLKHFGYIKNATNNLIGSTGFVVLTPIENMIDSKYLYYFISQDSVTQYLSAIAESSTTTYPSFKPTLLKEMNIPYPTIYEQKKIGNILSAFDDKIKLNNQINKNLEEMAQAIFKSWFVDFEPFLDGDFEESEFGMIPKNWNIKKLEDIVDIKNGFAFKSKDYIENGTTLIRTKNFSDNGHIELNDVIYLPNQFYDKYKNFQLSKFDLLLVMVGASVGKISIVNSNILPALQNQNMWNFKAKNSNHQVLTNLIIRKIVDENIHTASGSAREFFRKDYFKSIKILYPDLTIIDRIVNLLLPIYEKIDNNINENYNLKQQKDILLPKLMSGEIRV